MNVLDAVEGIKRKFAETGRLTIEILNLRGDPFKVELKDKGVKVSNLRNYPFLPWAVFQEAVCLLIRKNGRAKRGNAMNHKLGDPGLPLDSVEGHVACVVYGKRPGEFVFRRITPIACILIWAGICGHARGELVLVQ